MTHEYYRQLVCTISASALPMQLLAIKHSLEVRRWDVWKNQVLDKTDLCRKFSPRNKRLVYQVILQHNIKHLPRKARRFYWNQTQRLNYFPTPFFIHYLQTIRNYRNFRVIFIFGFAENLNGLHRSQQRFDVFNINKLFEISKKNRHISIL